MIDPTELSPGSVVKHIYAEKGEPLEAYDIYKYKKAIERGDETYYNTIKAIPINKDWLLSFDFKELNFGLFEKVIDLTRWSTHLHKKFTLFYDIRSDRFTMDITYIRDMGKTSMDTENYYHELPHIRYVHQLQQAIYILSGEKIKFNEILSGGTLSRK